ncbi:MAG: hypothetical protein Phyf2KO_09280 [Phycisphaerales bacterium]
MKQQLRLLARAWKYRRKLDPAEIRFVLDTVKPGDRVIDLGAHKGAYTYWLAKAAGSKGKVVAVEPQKNLADKLESLMASRQNVSVKWAAISEHTGKGTLSLRPDGSSHGASIAGFSDGNVGDTVEVPTVTLSDLMVEQRLNRIDFIKCDVEGHEGEVFNVSRDVLKAHRPTILLECENRHAQGDFGGVDGLRKIFEPLGFRIRFFCSGKLYPIDEFNPEIHQNYGHGEYCNNFVVDYVRQ